MILATAARQHMAWLLAILAAALVGCGEKHPRLEELPPAVVDVATPLERTVTDYQIFTGRTQAVQSVDLKARVTGYLTKVNFKDGDPVKEGEVLFEIDDRPYKAALDDATGALAHAKAALVEAQAEYEIGDNLRKSSPGAISEQNVVARLGTRDKAKAAIDEAKANLESAQLNYNWCKVNSPISGLAARHLVDVGNIVDLNVTSLVSIVSLKPVWVYVNVDQNTGALRASARASGQNGRVSDRKSPGANGRRRGKRAELSDRRIDRLRRQSTRP